MVVKKTYYASDIKNPYWIGAPLGSRKKGPKGFMGNGVMLNKPHDFFKTNKKNTMSYMFKDNDRDGVANVFDCKPNNPYEQGLIDAIVGAGKAVFTGGGVKKAWREGMDDGTTKHWKKERTPAEKPRVGRIIRLNEQIPQRALDNSGQTRTLSAEKPRIGDYDRYVAKLESQIKAQEKAKKWESGGKYVMKKSGEVLRRYQRAFSPNYSLTMEFRGRKMKGIKNQLANENLSDKQRTKLRNQLERAEFRQEKEKAQQRKTQSARRVKTIHRAVEMAFPPTYLASYGSASGGKTVSGVPGRGRGRPRGSLDRRYAPYGGVMGYRKYLSQQRRTLRDQLQKQAQMMKMNRIKRMPQYEQIQQARTVEGMNQIPQQMQQAQQVQQVPQELQGQMQQDITPDYQQFLEQQQMQMQGQQIPQEQVPSRSQSIYNIPNMGSAPPQRPIVPAFKQGSGSPYPPVNRQSLAPSRQTVPQGYVETTDAFTGRRIIKKLPPPERWATGGI